MDTAQLLCSTISEINLKYRCYEMKFISRMSSVSYCSARNLTSSYIVVTENTSLPF